jgi:hypothetical protein
VSTASLTFDKTQYTPSEVITVTWSTDAPMTETLTVTGSVEAADGTDLPATSTTTIHGVYSLDPVAGYTVAQSPDNPAVFTLTPAGS